MPASDARTVRHRSSHEHQPSLSRRVREDDPEQMPSLAGRALDDLSAGMRCLLDRAHDGVSGS